MSAIVPYIISFANNDYKRPYVEQVFGQGTVDDYKNNVLVMICETVYDLLYENEEEDEQEEEEKSVEERIASICTEYSMTNNNAWEANAFVDGKWNDVTPTNKQIAQSIIRKKASVLNGEEEEALKGEEDSDEEDDDINTSCLYIASATFPYIDICDKAAFERLKNIFKTFPYDKTNFNIYMEYEDAVCIDFRTFDYVALSDIA